MRTVAVIQARMESSRFPGKVMADICGLPMVQRVIRRVKAAHLPDAVMLCIPDTPDNGPLRVVAAEEGLELAYQYPLRRGGPNDLMFAYYNAGIIARADLVVRITADCPLVDPTTIDQVIQTWQPGIEYCSNVIRRTFPRGLDAEIVPRGTLGEAWFRVTYEPDFEHVTLVFRRNLRQYRIASVEDTENHSDLNLSVNTPEDLERVRAIYARLPDPLACYQDVLAAAGVTHGA